MNDLPEKFGFAEEAELHLGGDPYECSAEHDAYLRKEITKTLERKARDKVEFVSIDEAIKTFLPDAH